MFSSLSARRAWIEIYNLSDIDDKFGSLSARRAWIEIGMRHNVCRGFAVALRKESVDRNNSLESKQIDPSVSLSARRAWIEIQKKVSIIVPSGVALRKESVDRNIIYLLTASAFLSRSPQGERG